jgi:hypothetical protein
MRRGSIAHEPAVRVLFVAGMPRSGSTLFDLMAGQLPGHCDVGELFYLWQAGPLRNQLCACGQPFDTCAFWTQVGKTAFGGWDTADVAEVVALQSRVDTTARLPLAYAGSRLPDHQVDVRRYLELTTTLYRAIAEVSGADVVVDSTKRPSTAHLLAGAAGVDLRLVHIVRDPRGVVNSWRREVALPDRVEVRNHLKRRRQSQITRRWVTVNLMIEQLARRGVPLHRVRYEDLVADPVAAMTGVLALWDRPSPRDGFPFLTDKGLLTGKSHAVAGGRVRLRTGAVPLLLDEGWRRELPAWRRRLTTVGTWPLMRRYGYR